MLKASHEEGMEERVQKRLKASHEEGMEERVGKSLKASHGEVDPEVEQFLTGVLRNIKQLKLQSSNKEKFYVDFSLACQSQLIQNVIEDTQIDQPILLPNVSGEILEKVIEYMVYHGMRNIPDELINQWDTEFLEVDTDTLFGLIWAADYLQIPNLLDLACKGVANVIKDKTAKEIREKFNIKNDFTPEETEKITRQKEWFFL